MYVYTIEMRGVTTKNRPISSSFSEDQTNLLLKSRLSVLKLLNKSYLYQFKSLQVEENLSFNNWNEDSGRIYNSLFKI